MLFGSNITTRTALIALMGRRSSAAPPRTGIALISVARRQGAATGAALHALGINVDFAPVATSTSPSFLYRQA